MLVPLSIPRPTPLSLRLLLLGAVFAATALVWYVLLFEDRRGKLTVAFLDVGQGDAIFIEAPSGRQALVDGGSDRGVLRELGKLMPFYDRSIDLVVATHPDKDHIGGLPDVLERYRVSVFLDPGAPSDTAAYRALERLVGERVSERYRARRGMVVDLGGGAEFRILFPDRDLGKVSDTNGASVVARLSYGETDVLLTGDAPERVERYLLSLSPDELRSDILKVGHHGSRTSSDASFLSAAAPAFAVVSAGRGNPYGHPHADVLARLRAAGAEILGTAERGTVIFSSRGGDPTLLPAPRPCRMLPSVFCGGFR